MSRLRSSMRVWKSSMFSNTTARPRVLHQLRRRRRRLDDRAVGREVAAQHRDAGVGLERLLERLDHVAVVAGRVLVVLPDRLAVGGERVLVQQTVLARARASPPAGRRRSRSPPSGTCPTAAGSTRQGSRCRARSKSSSVSLTPMRPRDRDQVDHRVGRAADRGAARGSRSRTPRAVRIFDSVRSSLTISTMRRPAIARDHVAPPVDRRDTRRCRAGRCRAPRPSTPSSRRCPSSCSGRASGACTSRPRRSPPA